MAKTKNRRLKYFVFCIFLICIQISRVNSIGNGIKVPDLSTFESGKEGTFSFSSSIFKINYRSTGETPVRVKSVKNLNSNSSGAFVIADDRVKSLLMSCSSSFCPVQWQLEKFQYASFPTEFKGALTFENERESPNFWNVSSYIYKANLTLESSSSQLTGNYSCGCAQKPGIKFWVYVFWQGSTSEFLLQGGGVDSIKRISVYRPKAGNSNSNSNWVSFYCGVSDPTKNVYLHRVLKKNSRQESDDPKLTRYKTIKVEVNETYLIQDLNEFHVNLETFPQPFGLPFLCSLNEEKDGEHFLPDPNVLVIQIWDKREPMLPKYHLTHTTNLWEQSNFSVNYDLALGKISCCSRQPSKTYLTSGIIQIGFYCQNPSTCKFFKNRFAKNHNAKDYDGRNCSSYTLPEKPKDGAVIFRCINKESQTDAEYFFSRQEDPIFSWNDAKPENLVELKLVSVETDIGYETLIPNGEKKLVYRRGSHLEFLCESSTFYFSRGIRFLLHKSKVASNQNLTSFESGATVVNYDLTLDEMRSQGYQVFSIGEEQGDKRLLKIQIFNSEFISISCHAPVWNSSEWFNASLHLNFSEESEDVKILENKGEGEMEISVTPSSGKPLKLTCSASGEPLPKFKWLKNDVQILDTKNIRNITNTIEKLKSRMSRNETDSIVRTTLIIPKYEEERDRGKYVCEAINSAFPQPKRRAFNVKMEAEGISGLVLGITIGVIIFLIILLSVSARILIIQKRKIKILTEEDIYQFERGNPVALEQLQGKNKDVNSQAQLLPYNSDYEVPRETLVTDESVILGEGEFGLVIKGTLFKNGTTHQVAVKMVKHQNQDIQYFKILLSELKIMAFIGHHENIVSLVGAYSRNIRNKELLVAVEFCENGSLHDFLKECRPYFKKNVADLAPKIPTPSLYQNERRTVSFLPGFRQSQPREQTTNIVRKKQHEEVTVANLYRWSEQIASGMDFLSNKNVIHSDLATRNILLAGDLTAKIGDFGLSKFLFEYSTYVKKSKSPLPWRWISLEGLRDMEFSVQSDVWSFGVVLWEIFSLARVPYPGMIWDTDFMEKLENNYRLERPEFVSEEMYELMLQCWMREPADRPSFSHLVYAIQNLQMETPL